MAAAEAALGLDGDGGAAEGVDVVMTADVEEAVEAIRAELAQAEIAHDLAATRDADSASAAAEAATAAAADARAAGGEPLDVARLRVARSE